jgi:hypothetical protein
MALAAVGRACVLGLCSPSLNWLALVALHELKEVVGDSVVFVFEK